VSGDAVDREAVSRWADVLGYSELWQTLVKAVDEANAGGA
jgi:hypothetical protein